MVMIPIVPITDDTCETCDNRLGEECGYSGKEVYDDTPACSEYSDVEPPVPVKQKLKPGINPTPEELLRFEEVHTTVYKAYVYDNSIPVCDATRIRIEGMLRFIVQAAQARGQQLTCNGLPIIMFTVAVNHRGDGYQIVPMVQDNT